MTAPGWFSQPYPPEGASAAEGIRNQLGRPELDLMTILVREAAQNSWDARPEGSTAPVEFRLDLRDVGPAELRNWHELLLADAPRGEAAFPLHATLRRTATGNLRPVRILAVSDRGTSGLGGPTRADVVTNGDRDFVTFLRNTGEPRDTTLGGGTYGFGKGIFYLLSRSGTILVHTRCRNERGEPETRLMGCTLWKSYTSPADGRQYTGRHWWGDRSHETVEPLIGSEAEATARKLGLGHFAPDETGTTVVVVDPKFSLDSEQDDLSSAEAADYLAESIAWHLWPKMLPRRNGEPPMRFRVGHDGREVPVPDPAHMRPLNLFVTAYRNMLERDDELWCRNPKKLLGRIGLVKRIVPGFESTPASRQVGIDRTVHHVCLMRPAELVVTYFPGPKPPTENIGYAGVFRGDIGMDDAYAQAEPPTHDAWNPQSLDGHEATYVRTTFRRLRERLADFGLGKGRIGDGATRVALGAASSRFAGLVGGTWGVGGATDYLSVRTMGPSESDSGPAARRSRRRARAAAAAGSDAVGAHEGTPRTASGARRPRVAYLGEPYYQDRGDDCCLVQEIQLPVPVRQRLRAELTITLPGTGGRETDPPKGARMPRLVGWEDPDGRLHSEVEPVVVGGDGTMWRAIVQPAPDTVTEIAIRTEGVRER
ncbi:hypothetical protein [Streptomyces sp. TR06-5]|uniref:hypothetical protein n=1 Tax=Streptomyces sp. TR06-5 TaxID=3385976 RepID=UPI0039A24BF0